MARSLALAVYNVLSKLASAALILPISEAIGQLKWTWFCGNESKEMIDFEIFDKASRGAWGSFLLLFRTKGRSLAAFGAILTLLLLATDTFFQQVTDYPDRWALEHVNSTIASVIRYKPAYIPEYYLGWEESQYDTNTMPTVQKFLYGNGTQSVQSGNATRPEVPLSCPASNCTWPEYDTLAVCGQCVRLDPVELLTYTCLNTSIDWSAHTTGPTKDVPIGQVCGYFVNATSDTPTLMSGYIVTNDSDSGSTLGEALLVRALSLTQLYTKKSFYSSGSIHFKDLRNTLLDALFVSASNGSQSVYSKAEPIMHECVLSWCVKTIKSSYAWGSYQEEVTAVARNTTPGPSPWDSFEVPEDEGGGWFATYQEDINIESPASSLGRDSSVPTQQQFGADTGTVEKAMAIFDDFFPSYYTVDNASASPVLRYKNYMDGPKIRTLDFNAWLAPNNLTSHISRMATAVTNAMRSNRESITMVPGLAYNKKQYVLVRWEWLTFPFALLVLSLGFLIATIFRTSGDGEDEMGVWKTSAMPTLIYSLPKDLQQHLKAPQSFQGRSRKVKIRLQPNQGWRVSGHALPSPAWIRNPNHQPPPGWI
ncbi:hypothetical protein N0V86_002905 [Didymella sp. IMI 355093]|nr:hypothetical protein N0V86_002905 [Didymella sp. IMI 355093]